MTNMTQEEREQIEFSISRMRRQILIHSYLYYALGTTAATDWEWNYVAKRLVHAQNEYPDIAEECILHEEFFDFDGSTGMHLWSRRPPIIEQYCKIACEQIIRWSDDVARGLPTGCEHMSDAQLLIAEYDIIQEILDMGGKTEWI